MTIEVQHTDVAAYALGLLEDDDRRAFEEHLAHCTLCTEELGDFAGMAEMLEDVPPIEPRADDDDVGGGGGGGGELVDLLRRRKVAVRSRRRGTAVLGAAAGVILLAGGALAGGLASDDGAVRHGAMPGHSASFDEVFQVGERVSAADTTTGVTGLVAMRPEGWGTEVGMELSHLRGPLVCELVAVSRSGARHTVTEWRVPRKGYGVPGSPASLKVHGGTAVERADLARFDVRIEGSDRTILSIPV